MISYITYEQLIDDSRAFARLVPPIQGIVAVPRSGLLPATVLAMHLHLPLTTLGSISFDGGSRIGFRRDVPAGSKVLVMDDSIYQGTAMSDARLKMLWSGYDCIFAALYRHPDGNAEIDLYLRDVPGPRYFEWNLLQNQSTSRFMCDIDGVLCYDPTVFDDDGELYQRAIAEAVPLHLPRFDVGCLISNRLERWRSITIDWMQRHRVSYQQLALSPYPTANDRRAAGDYGRYKGEVYRDSPLELFVESSESQASRIFEVSGKPVICNTSGEVFQ